MFLVKFLIWKTLIGLYIEHRVLLVALKLTEQTTSDRIDLPTHWRTIRLGGFHSTRGRRFVYNSPSHKKTQRESDEAVCEFLEYVTHEATLACYTSVSVSLN